MKTVLVIQQQMKQYRVPFFRALAEALRRDDICLKVAYSEPSNGSNRKDNCVLPPDLGSKVQCWRMLGGRIVWQSVLHDVLAADLVITEQANRLLLNYVLMALSLVGLRRVAFWGMGEDRCADRSALSERIRRHAAKMVNWWFTYTPTTAQYLISNGVSPSRITVVHNSVDTRAFAESVGNIGESELAVTREQLGIEKGARIALFCGALGPHKGVDFLLDCARVVREQIPDFHLLVLGSGPDSAKVDAVGRDCPWIHYIGPRFGPEKAPFFRIADLFLMPEGVGLAILDGFAAGLPLITTKFERHGPELEYLQPGYNGEVTEHNVPEYAAKVIDILRNPSVLDKLKESAHQTGKRFSVESMAANFCSGIKNCFQLQ